MYSSIQHKGHFLFLISAVLLLLVHNDCFAQSDNIELGKWSINLEAGIEEHDKRLGNVPAGSPLLTEQSEFFGTYSVVLGGRYRLLTRQRLHLHVGLDHVYSLITFMRPWEDATLPADFPTTDIYTWMDRHRELLLAPVISIRYRVRDRLWVGTSLRPHYRYHVRTIDRERVREYYDGPWQTGFRSVEAYLNLTYTLSDHFSVVGRYRAAQYHRNDLHLINSYLNSPVRGESPTPKYEWYNPVKLTFGISYRW